MRKILIENDANSTPAQLFIKGVQESYPKLQLEYRAKFSWEVSNDDIDWADVFIAVRPYSIFCYQNALATKKAGLFYIVNFDDDLLNYDEAYPARREYAKKCLALADVLTGVNEYLLKGYLQYCKCDRIVTTDTIVNEKEIHYSEQIDDKLHILFAAGYDHYRIFDKLITPILDEFLDKYRDKVDLTFIAVAPDLKHLRNYDCVKYVEGMKLQEYNQYMSTHHYDIGVAPLDDCHFNRCKYYNKYLEYSKVGIAGLYANMPPYTSIIKDGINGLLVDENPQAWLEKLSLIVENTQLRKDIVVNSQRQLVQQFNSDYINEKAKRLTPELWDYEKPANSKANIERHRLKEIIFLFNEKLYRTIYVMKHEGLKSTFVHIMRKVKGN